MDSSDEDDPQAQGPAIERAYDILDIRVTMKMGGMYEQAVGELDAIVSSLYKARDVPKKVKSSLESDVMAAMDTLDWENESHRNALARLMNTVNAVFPKLKKGIVMREYRQKNVLVSRRRGKKRNRPEIQHIPDDIKLIIFEKMDPYNLARARCVCKAWRDLASSTELWAPLHNVTFGEVLRDPEPMMSFSIYASEYPELLLPWLTKRIALHGYVRLMSKASWSRHVRSVRGLGLACRGAKYPKMAMFLSPCEVALWLSRPRSTVLNDLAKTWVGIRDRVQIDMAANDSIPQLKFWSVPSILGD